jgi:UDP-2,3-diacylglucosamine hydrolase
MPAPELIAPEHWACIDFISDLHLQAGDPATVAAWRAYLHSSPADALVILGDLFEVWVGDDVLDAVGAADSFEANCCKALLAAAQQRGLFLLHGNRDFLLGPAFARAAGLSLLADPTVLVFGGQRWLLSHGDALCLDDTEYQHFRQQVRSTGWQQAFLAQPLAARQATARELRRQSEARKQSGVAYADLDPTATRAALRLNGAPTLIHGHTHRPSAHDLGAGLQRVVLSDWDLTAPRPRAEALRLTLDSSIPNGAVLVQRIPLAGNLGGDLVDLPG